MALRKLLLQQINACKNELNHAWSWKECQDGSILSLKAFHELMTTTAGKAEEFREKMAGIRGQVLARKQRQE